MSGDGAWRARGRERARRPVAAAGDAGTGAEDAHHFRGTYRSTNSPASFCMLRERLWSPPQRREDGPCPRAPVRPRPAPTRAPGRHPAQAPTHARESVPAPPRPRPPRRHPARGPAPTPTAAARPTWWHHNERECREEGPSPPAVLLAGGAGPWRVLPGPARPRDSTQRARPAALTHFCFRRVRAS